MKIAVVGIGYVGLSITLLLAQKNEVIATDIIPEKIENLNNKISPIKNRKVEDFIKNKKLNFKATSDSTLAYKDADFVVIATPTNYDEKKKCFDTLPVEKVIKQVIQINPGATIVIKSTVPIGFTESIRKKYSHENILFSPEFLRENKALYDNLYPSRIIVGTSLTNKKLLEKAKKFADLLKQSAIKKNVPIRIVNTTEAEAIKLFANTYLAMRVSFFNELDTYASVNSLDTKSIIDGVCLDLRIGNRYNNPSFGYGGHCLSKDIKQLLANYKNVPQNIISAIIYSNTTRKDFIANQIISKKPKIVGIYRLVTKTNSGNFRQSVIQGIIKRLKEKNIEVVVYEPVIKEKMFLGSIVIKNISTFKQISDIIIANRYSKKLKDVNDKVYTRDVYFRE